MEVSVLGFSLTEIELVVQKSTIVMGERFLPTTSQFLQLAARNDMTKKKLTEGYLHAH